MLEREPVFKLLEISGRMYERTKTGPKYFEMVNLPKKLAAERIQNLLKSKSSTRWYKTFRIPDDMTSDEDVK